ITYSVSAMTCPNCVRSVSEALGKLSGVGSVAVSLESGTAVVVPTPGYSSSSVLETLADIGHQGELMSEGEENGSSCSCSSCHS
ncbi:MAG: heavy-metal-associated domain-containing protein, partial [Candidatus Sabulitectum sp.]|nr:heavy-metal-associated domain-containing protein [Candidatus Sabulitectum sp.]